MDTSDPKPSDGASPGDPVHGNGSEVLMHMPVDVRSVSLGVLAVLACIVILRWAADVFIPLMIGVMLAYALSPVVDRLVRWRIPAALAAALVMLSLVGGVAVTGYVLEDDAMELIDSLPETARKIGQVLRPSRSSSDSALQKVEKAAAEIERAANDGAAPTPTRGVTRVRVERPSFNIRDHLWIGTIGLATLVGQAVIVLFITFFMLASGDTFRRKLVKIAGPTFSKKKITVQMLDEITALIQRYLLVQVFTSVLVGITTWLVFMWIGLEQAPVWGVLAGVLNMIPYLGAIAVTGGSALVGFVQFGSVEMGLVVGGASFVIQTIEGYLVTPWLTSRAIRMSPVVVFVAVLLFGWLWGVWGLLLGVPIVMVIKAVCERVDDLKPIGELLGA